MLVLLMAACAPIDDVGALDVLSRAGPVADATGRDAGTDAAADASRPCKMLSDACTSCIAIVKCLAEWTACLAETPCRQGIPVVRNCDCDAQLLDAGALVQCGATFQAVGMNAVALAQCTVAQCATECGL